MSSGNTEKQIMLMKDFQTTVLICTPSYALHIAEVAEKMGIDPKKDLNVVITSYSIHYTKLYDIPFLNTIFSVIGASGAAVSMAVDYSSILFGGAVALLFTNIANAILRGEGDTKRSMYAIILGSVLNIILDPIFIYVLDMGVAGAAWATIISLFITCLLFVYCRITSYNVCYTKLLRI